MSASSRKNAQSYRPDVDGLRAVAVASVVVFHAFPSTLAGGFVGVDIFFAISGYLISQHIIETLDQGRFSLVDFYARRIKRIYPALIVVLIASLSAGLVLMASGELARLASDALASVAFVANIYFYMTQDYFSQGASASALLHLWSLGVEEQYYIVWPVALYVLWRFASRRVATLAIVATILLSLASSIYLSGTHATAAFYLPVTRFWELLFGSTLAWAEFHRARKLAASASQDTQPGCAMVGLRPPLRDFAAFAGLALIVASLVLFDPKTVFPSWRAALPTGGATLIIAAGPQAWLNRRVLSLKPFVYIGLISYPLYLWHWPILVFVRLLSSGAPTTSMLLAAVALAFVLSALTFYFIEAPARFSRPARRYPVRVASGLFAVMMGIGLSSYAISREDGLPGRFPDASFGAQKEGWTFTDECKKAFPGSDFCMTPAPNGRPEVALLGDSHANQYYAGLEPALSAGGAGLFAVGSGNCPPFYGIDIHLGGYVKHCAALFDGVLDYVIKSPDIHSVILSSYAISSITGGFDYDTGGYIRLVAAAGELAGRSGEGSNLDVYLAGLERTLSKLTAADKTVVFVLDTPELDFDPNTCVRRPVQISVRSPCAVPRAKVDHRLTGTQARILAVLDKFPAVKVFNPVPLLCDAQSCYARQGAEFFYADRDHLSSDGSRYIGKWLVQDLKTKGGT
ncbi:acyltransferase family protein [Paraburkholderia oxyphila]|uniref:acyltransferase family protein n=1 Tax=Paraburkholderia oxyphila TaxID=614212 RepID=UPI000483C337|nr:acyltransferase family protein [Paraburkholderia oxyphila]